MERLNDGETYQPAVIEMALRGPFQIMVQAQTAVDTWMQLFIAQRAPAVHREARQRRRATWQSKGNP